jgi:hypothetical protein
MKHLRFAIFLLLVALPLVSPSSMADAYGSGWYQEFQFATGYEDNISRSYKDEDQVSDTITTISYGAGHSRKLGRSSQLILSSYATLYTFDEFDDLSNFALNGSISWIYQPIPGYGSVWYDVISNLTMRKYKDNDAREGLSFDLDTSVNRRIKNNLVGHLGYRYHDIFFPQKNDSEKSLYEAFDVNGHEVYLALDYQMDGTSVLFAEYGFRKGDITSIISGSVEPHSDYDAKTPDRVFNNCGSSKDCNLTWAYRVETQMRKVTVGISIPIRQLNVDFSANYYDAESNSGQSYQDWMLKIGLLWYF